MHKAYQNIDLMVAETWPQRPEYHIAAPAHAVVGGPSSMAQSASPLRIPILAIQAAGSYLEIPAWASKLTIAAATFCELCFCAD